MDLGPCSANVNSTNAIAQLLELEPCSANVNLKSGDAQPRELELRSADVNSKSRDAQPVEPELQRDVSLKSGDAQPMELEPRSADDNSKSGDAQSMELEPRSAEVNSKAGNAQSMELEPRSGDEPTNREVSLRRWKRVLHDGKLKCKHSLPLSKSRFFISRKAQKPPRRGRSWKLPDPSGIFPARRCICARWFANMLPQHLDPLSFVALSWASTSVHRYYPSSQLEAVYMNFAKTILRPKARGQELAGPAGSRRKVLKECVYRLGMHPREKIIRYKGEDFHRNHIINAIVVCLCADPAVYLLPTQTEAMTLQPELRGLDGLARAGYLGLIKILRNKCSDARWNLDLGESRWDELERWCAREKCIAKSLQRQKLKTICKAPSSKRHIFFNSDSES